MAKIADMGFTAIQTSPVQPLKEATTDATDTVGGVWWVYYQPVDFKITDGAGNAVLLYYGNEALEEVSIQVIDVNNKDESVESTAAGAFRRTSLTDFVNGVAPWGQTNKQVVAQNGNVIISVLDADTDKINGDVLAEVIAEIEAIIAEGPVVVEETVEEAPADETAETPAE